MMIIVSAGKASLYFLLLFIILQFFSCQLSVGIRKHLKPNNKMQKYYFFLKKILIFMLNQTFWLMIAQFGWKRYSR